MSLLGVKLYARTRMRALGYTEHTDGFNWKNIPSTKLDKAFHVELGEARGLSNNQDSQDIDAPFTIRAFQAPRLGAKNLIDTGVSMADTIIADLLMASNRLTQTEIKTVRLNTVAVEPLDESNDNGIVVKINFTALVIISTR